jgi:hypothetical protein
MKLISLSKGKFAKVDDDLFDYLNQWKWHFDGKYARRNIYIRKNGKRKQVHILMHRFINDTPKGMFTDHKDGDCLNDQKANLRNCTKRTNAANMRKHRGASVYKGVSKHENKWRTQIWHNNEKVFAATCSDERWAAMIYDLNAAALFGEYARLNFSGAIVGMSVDASSSSPQSAN